MRAHLPPPAPGTTAPHRRPRLRLADRAETQARQSPGRDARPRYAPAGTHPIIGPRSGTGDLVPAGVEGYAAPTRFCQC